MKVMCLAPQDPANIRACLRESVNGQVQSGAGGRKRFIAGSQQKP